ncbi:hypothetical protein SBA5_1100009 [Candidatus Sulfotelmatomonas gaucii]|uniref:Uncharacterized protein n=1 Tax=Candidatus Sulfuritelmatomonas gaucii TaxID=2043161 RepID=A0A2N9L3N2_9BACT|nr:hypothetical protein SBA5_1100009 [Candidatus Sulfotelmatomonas gaucii]
MLHILILEEVRAVRVTEYATVREGISWSL